MHPVTFDHYFFFQLKSNVKFLIHFSFWVKQNLCSFEKLWILWSGFKPGSDESRAGRRNPGNESKLMESKKTIGFSIRGSMSKRQKVRAEMKGQQLCFVFPSPPLLIIHALDFAFNCGFLLLMLFVSITTSFNAIGLAFNSDFYSFSF